MQEYERVDPTLELPALSENVLRPCLVNTLSFSHNYSRERWKSEIEQEEQVALARLKQTCSDGKRTPRKGEYLKICERINERFKQHDFNIAGKVTLWEWSERNLNHLRTKGFVHLTDEQRSQALFKFIKEVKLDSFPELRLGALGNTGINHLLELTMPELVAGFGSPFYVTTPRLVPSDDCHFPSNCPQPAEQVIGINTDFWGALMGGDKRLGHEVVYFASESHFFYFDLVAGCYVPTSDEKVRLVASQALQRCAWGQESSVATKVLTTFRTKKVLDEIVAQAKVLLSAEKGFLDTKPRWTGTKKATDTDTDPMLFVKHSIEQAEAAVLTLGECLDRFEETGLATMSRKEMTEKIKGAITSIHHRRLRNDLTLPSGRGVSGWKGLRLRAPSEDEVNLVTQCSVIRPSEPPQPSEYPIFDQSSELALVS